MVYRLAKQISFLISFLFHATSLPLPVSRYQGRVKIHQSSEEITAYRTSILVARNEKDIRNNEKMNSANEKQKHEKKTVRKACNERDPISRLVSAYNHHHQIMGIQNMS